MSQAQQEQEDPCAGAFKPLTVGPVLLPSAPETPLTPHCSEEALQLSLECSEGAWRLCVGAELLSARSCAVPCSKLSVLMGKAAILGGRGEGAPQVWQELQREHPGARIYGLGNTLRRIRDETLQVQSVAEARTSSQHPWDVH